MALLPSALGAERSNVEAGENCCVLCSFSWLRVVGVWLSASPGHSQNGFFSDGFDNIKKCSVCCTGNDLLNPETIQLLHIREGRHAR